MKNINVRQVAVSNHKKKPYKSTPNEDPRRLFSQTLESYGGCSPPSSEGRISFGKYSCSVFKFSPCIIIYPKRKSIYFS